MYEMFRGLHLSVEGTPQGIRAGSISDIFRGLVISGVTCLHAWTTALGLGVDRLSDRTVAGHFFLIYKDEWGGVRIRTLGELTLIEAVLFVVSFQRLFLSISGQSNAYRVMFETLRGLGFPVRDRGEAVEEDQRGGLERVMGRS